MVITAACHVAYTSSTLVYSLVTVESGLTVGRWFLGPLGQGSNPCSPAYDELTKSTRSISITRNG